MPILRVLLPHIPAVSHVLTGARVTVGRRPDNTIQIMDPSISAHHAELLQVEDHYRLSDLDSTNSTHVEGAPVRDYHLHHSCRLTFGSVECEFEASPLETGETGLTLLELEKDIAFLRTENGDLQQKIGTLQRQIEILSTARLVTGRDEAPLAADAELLKRLLAERDDARQQNADLQQELEQVRGEADVTTRERDSLRRASEALRQEKLALQDAFKLEDKGTTQRIVFPMPAGRD